MRSIEIVFDEPTEQAFRARWQALVNADLPSLALHTSASNRPHITVAAGVALEPVSVSEPLPGTVRSAGTMQFPAHADRWVLVDAIVIDEPLLAFHRAVLAEFDEAESTSLPGRWVPHVTLSRRLRSELVGQALDVLREAPLPDELGVEGFRLWDGDTKTITEAG